MAVYTMLVRIADVTIRFESDMKSDIGVLSGFFKYHQVGSSQEIDCIVVLRRQASFYMPKDAKLQWQSNCHGIVENENRLGRRRVSFSSKVDAYGVASCYLSYEHGKYYYGLMHDKSWICYHPSEKMIDYILHSPPLKRNRPTPSRRGRLVKKELANPLSAMPLLIHVISTIHGRFLTHGAAIATNGMASLFLGKSGSGKSTLCTDLAKQNTTFMGDDLVLLYTKDGIPMVGSLLFPAKLHIDSKTEKTEVDVPEEMHTGYCLAAPLEAVYLVCQSGMRESSIKSCPPAELLQQLMDASNDMMMQYDRRQWLTTMYDICERVPYFVFHFGERSMLNPSILKLRPHANQ